MLARLLLADVGARPALLVSGSVSAFTCSAVSDPCLRRYVRRAGVLLLLLVPEIVGGDHGALECARCCTCSARSRSAYREGEGAVRWRKTKRKKKDVREKRKGKETKPAQVPGERGSHELEHVAAGGVLLHDRTARGACFLLGSGRAPRFCVLCVRLRAPSS